MDSQGVFSPEALRPHLSMGLPLKQAESSQRAGYDLRGASRRDKRGKHSGGQPPAPLLSPIIVTTVVAERRRDGRMFPDQTSVCRNGTPAARRGRKATGLPAMGRLPGYRTGSLSRNRHGVATHCNQRNYRGDGSKRPGLPACAARARPVTFEGGGGAKRKKWECSAGE